MTFSDVKDKILTALASLAVACLCWMAMSVTELNTNVAVVIAQIGQHETRIQNLELGKRK